MLWLAVIGLILPAAYHYLVGRNVAAREADLSLEISIVLIITYFISLLFSLHTHKQLFMGASSESGKLEKHSKKPTWSLTQSLSVLFLATALIAWISEMLVGSVEMAAHQMGMTSIFIGVIVVAIIGNAAEHSTAVLMAIKNRMDLSIGIAIGSSIQIALFVAPLLVIVSHFAGPRYMDLVFSPAEVLAIWLAVLISGQISGDGESNWLEGVQLLSVYIIMGLVFYFLPEVTTPPVH